MSQTVSVEITTGRFASLTRNKPAGKWWWSVTTSRGHEDGQARSRSAAEEAMAAAKRRLGW